MACPPVTVLTPSPNRGEFIGETLRSVLGQDHPDGECVVVDGGSTDGAPDILRDHARRYPGRLTWTCAPDRGQTEALNKGFVRAGGEILGWLNADDVYAAGAIRAAVPAFTDAPEAAVVYDRARFIGAAGEDLGPYPVIPPFNWQGLGEQCYICQPAASLRRRSFLDSGLLDERLRSCMDDDLGIRLGRRDQVRFIDADVAAQRMHKESKTCAGRGRMFAKSLRVVKRHYGHALLSWCQAYAGFPCYGGDQFFTLPQTDWRIGTVRRLLFLRHNVRRPGYLLATLRERQRKRRADRL